MHIHADHRGIRFDCGLCGKEFKRKGSLDRHVLGNDLKNLLCPL